MLKKGLPFDLVWFRHRDLLEARLGACMHKLNDSSMFVVSPLGAGMGYQNSDTAVVPVDKPESLRTGSLV